MDSFQINKFLGAILGTCLVLVAVHIAAGALFSEPAPAKPGYEIAVKEEQPAQKAGAPAAAPANQSVEALLPTASADQGAKIAKVCQTCHNLQEGQGPKIGPDLYGVVGRPVASVAGFKYSAPLKAKGGTWTFAALDKWLTDPRADVPGTAMTFAGFSSAKQRADVIAYLDTLSAHPVPLPTAQQGNAAKPPAATAANPPPPANASPSAPASAAPAPTAPAPAAPAPKQ